jgi:hypothetical protein
LSAANKGATEEKASRPKTARMRRATDPASVEPAEIRGTVFTAALLVFRFETLEYTQNKPARTSQINRLISIG